jgi:alanyl-tRNA synthetase
MNEKTFDLDFFKENKFIRQRCKKCGEFFWSLVKRDTCGEPPCEVYTFIGKPFIPRRYDWKEMRETYINWFEKNGHQPINRYPTVARWKPDTFFTGASIYCFMPWVLNKTIEPPANPLVMSQPSVRFVDLDNVGLGTGRHGSMFEMMAHHAFNYPKEIYWKTETADYCFRWLTEELKVKPELIVFKENWWEGGGNAGPCLEVLVEGDEVATLVFMEYEGPFDGKYKQMDMKVVDTGYGLERNVWGSTGTSTIYDSVFGNIIKFLKKKAGIKNNEKILTEFCKMCGVLDIKEKNVDVLRERIINEVSRKLKIEPKEILGVILPYHKIYQIADHTKTIMFILGDGVVPSNVEEGYLARLMIRRSIRNMKDLNLNILLSEIVEKQINDVKEIYPEFKENKEDILKMVDIEQEKYSENLKRGAELVRKIVAPMEVLDQLTTTTLYESHGLLPTDVKKIVPDIKVDLTDIETKIAVQKSDVKKTEERKLMDITDLPDTKKLFYENERLFDFKAKVLKVDGDLVVLDQTAFYPRGGGQEPDLGTIDGYRVYDVEPEGTVIIHKVEKHKLKKGDVVSCKVDSNRRKQIIKHHTATHLINGAARKLLGYHVWQAGSKKDIDKAHLDITHYENLNEDQVKEIERIVNEAIENKMKVKKEILDRNTAEKRYGFRIYQGGAVPGKMLRIISISDFDAEACGGLHVDNTSEIEKVFIFSNKKMQDGIIRLEYVAGKELVEKTKKDLKEQKLLEAERQKKKMSEIEKEKEKYMALQQAVRMTAIEVMLGINYKNTEDMKEIETIGKESIKEKPYDYSVIIGKGIVFGIKGEKCKVDVEKLVKEAAKTMGGFAGGSKNEFKGGGPLKEKSKEAYEKIKNI